MELIFWFLGLIETFFGEIWTGGLFKNYFFVFAKILFAEKFKKPFKPTLNRDEENMFKSKNGQIL
jgi:hypothetical protein